MPPPLAVDLAPMEARLAHALPEGDGWQFEPKWDGFRCLVFRAGSTVALRSKAGLDLGRYFPEVVAAVTALPGGALVLDGELVIRAGAGWSFSALQLRLHPADSRIRRLAAASPAVLQVFDLLAERTTRWHERPLQARRAALEALAPRFEAAGGRLALSPATLSRARATRWLAGAGSGLDGVVAKRLDLPYLPGSRDAMVKVKRARTADCVVGGFRYGSGRREVGSLLLGLYDAEGLLHHVGFTAGIPARERPRVTAELEALRAPPGFTGRAPGGPSRWSGERATAWEPLTPRLVVEVGYDHVSEGRFRHGTRLVRWRADKPPRQCTLDQIEA